MHPSFAKTPDGLAMAGTALYGPRWQAALAYDLGISRRMVVYMAAGDKNIPEKQWRQIAALLEEKSQECKAMAATIIESGL